MKINHINIETNKIDETISFYCNIIGLKLGSRPNFGFDGAWLYHGKEPIIHIMPDFTNKDLTHFLGHIAFQGECLSEFLVLLKKYAVENYTKNIIPGTGETQIFIKDPNNIKIEIQFSRECENEK